MFTLDLQGLPQLTQAFQRLAVQAQQALVVALQAEAERILEESLPLVPVDTGLLVSSGMVEQQSQGADIRYGGHGLAPYSIIVHESVEMNHPNGGQHHYLSAPFLAATGDMAQRLATDMASHIRP
jgi:hypothetical protein